MPTFAVQLADQRRARTDSHGIINFSLGLTRALPAVLGDDERLVVIANGPVADELGDAFLRPHDDLRIAHEPRTGARRFLLDHAGIRRLAADADVVVFPKGFLPIGPRPGFATVACLHDDIPLRGWRDPREPARRRLRFGYFAAMLRWSMARADRRLFVSAFSRHQLCARARGPRSSDVVIHEGIDVDRLPFVPLDARAPRALVLGSPLAHKRTAWVLQRLQELGPLAGSLEEVLVLGHLPPVPHRRLPVVHEPGPVDGPTLSRILADSRLLLFPSEYEGFGLPPVEAAALGTPVVYADSAAASEVLDGVPGACPVDADPGRFRDAIRAALDLDEPELRRVRDLVWDRFDWPVVAARVAEALRHTPTSTGAAVRPEVPAAG